MASKNKNTNKTSRLPRPPVVTLMGHVDHGKTSILDAICKTRIAAKEVGSMSQHVHTCSVLYQGQRITFIDTPGHAAFSQMRSRGGQVADIVALVVAADDGVKPQTKEALDHARSAQVPIIVVVNKIDLPGADPARVYQQLAQEGLLVEGLGGEVVAVEVSAKTGEGLDNFLEVILLVGEVEGLVTESDDFAKGVVLESWRDSRQGVSANIIVRSGEFRVGEVLCGFGGLTGKIKALLGPSGERLDRAGCGEAVVVVGLDDVPEVGSVLVDDKGLGYIKKLEELWDQQKQWANLESFSQSSQDTKILNIVLKADARGSLEAVRDGLSSLSLSNENLTINIIHAATGDISESDVLLASASGAVILGFNVKLPKDISYSAKTNRVEVRLYNLIFELLDDVASAIQGLFKEEHEKIKGRAEVIKLFPLPSGDVVLGCRVLGGVISVGDKVFVSRKGEEIHRAAVNAIKVGKDRVKRVATGDECGILLKPQYPSRKGDQLDRL